MKQFIFSSILVLFVSCLFAQQKVATIVFDVETLDFGTIKEEVGMIKKQFKFTNTGSMPLIISKVKASCGCTTPKWTEKPIMPGEKGFIDVTYNAKGRPGKFTKSVTVTSNAEPSMKVLRITGVVIPKVKTLADYYPFTVGQVRMRINNMSFGPMKNTQIKVDTFSIVNVSNEDVKLHIKASKPHLTVKITPELIKPKEKAIVKITYDANKKQDWGYVHDKIYLLINGKEVPNSKGRITISADIREDFSKLTPEQLETAPSIGFDNKMFEFGTLKDGETANYEFKLTNKGKSDLIIRKIKPSCGCTAVNLGDKVIKPGETTTLKVVFDSKGQRSRVNKIITVISNDPLNYKTILRVRGNVEKEKKKCQDQNHDLHNH